jgi:hypothetical protein
LYFTEVIKKLRNLKTALRQENSLRQAGIKVLKHLCVLALGT